MRIGLTGKTHWPDQGWRPRPVHRLPNAGSQRWSHTCSVSFSAVFTSLLLGPSTVAGVSQSILVTLLVPGPRERGSPRPPGSRREDIRRFDVVADGLPLFAGAQLVVDTTAHANGEPHRGAALVAAHRRTERTHPELERVLLWPVSSLGPQSAKSYFGPFNFGPFWPPGIITNNNNQEKKVDWGWETIQSVPAGDVFIENAALCLGFGSRSRRVVSHGASFICSRSP